MVLEIKIWAAGMLIDTEVSFLLGPLRWQSKEIYMYSVLRYIHIYKYFCVTICI